jgi:hypothetical protein
MGGHYSQFIQHQESSPLGTTYIYTRSNRFGAVETRRTVVSNRGFDCRFDCRSDDNDGIPVTSTVSFSDGRGYVDFVRYRGCSANNLSDYTSGGPNDGFNAGDYSYLYNPPVCTCGRGCGMA